MKSLKTFLKESVKATVKEQPNLRSTSDLYSLELSQVLLQAMDAGMIEPEASSDQWGFHLPMCRTHMMASLLKCLMCIEAERANLPTAA
jgi:hypothetical protein